MVTQVEEKHVSRRSATPSMINFGDARAQPYRDGASIPKGRGSGVPEIFGTPYLRPNGLT